MKTFALLLALSASAAMARPGGYTANGGVYKFDPDRDLDYMTHARNAGKREGGRIPGQICRYFNHIYLKDEKTNKTRFATLPAKKRV